jgi:gamma-glutamylcyclotransferase (GGCT)/AIG2-like uncharacterized protein YtfP
MALKLFAYGTLRRGHANAGRFGLDDCPAKVGVTLNGFDLFNLGWFPGIRPGTGTVTGDLYDIPNDMVPALDAYEGAPHLYTREIVNVAGVDAYTYVYHQPIDQSRLIPTGDWWDLKEK